MTARPILIQAAASVQRLAANLRAERGSRPDDHVLTDAAMILDTVSAALIEAALQAEQRRVEAARSVA